MKHVKRRNLSRQAMIVLNKGLNTLRNKGGPTVDKNVGIIQRKLNKKLSSIRSL